MKTVTINNMPPAAPMTCRTCGHTGPGNEYHPFAFCVLYKAGQSPWDVVRKAGEAAGWMEKP